MMTWEERHPTTLEGWLNFIVKTAEEFERKKKEAAENKKAEEEKLPVPAVNNNENKTVEQQNAPVAVVNEVVAENPVAPRQKRKYTRRAKEVVPEYAVEMQLQQAVKRSRMEYEQFQSQYNYAAYSSQYYQADGRDDAKAGVFSPVPAVNDYENETVEQEKIPVPAENEMNNNEGRTVEQQMVPVAIVNEVVAENPVAPRKKRKYTRRSKEVVPGQAVAMQLQQATKRIVPVPAEDEIVAENPFAYTYTSRVEEVVPGHAVEMQLQAVKTQVQNQYQQSFFNYSGQFDDSASSIYKQQELTGQYNYAASSSHYYQTDGRSNAKAGAFLVNPQLQMQPQQQSSTLQQLLQVDPRVQPQQNFPQQPQLTPEQQWKLLQQQLHQQEIGQMDQQQLPHPRAQVQSPPVYQYFGQQNTTLSYYQQGQC